jgi:hypothetical protein
MNLKARIAFSLLDKWALVACKPVGGSNYLMSPAEMVGRAMETAERAVDDMVAMGWMNEEDEE